MTAIAETRTPRAPPCSPPCSPMIRRRASRAAIILATTLLLGGCAATERAVDWMNGTTPDSRQVAALPFPPSISGTPVRIVVPPTPLQCVPYARKVSRVSIRGDAWTWWRSAKGRYRRGGTPSVGSVLVLKRTRRLRLGHLAVVKAIVNDRLIVVDQANWLNRGRIHLNIPVRDVSARNDWSAVRVWYAPEGNYGNRTYPVQGFIAPESPRYTPTHPTRRG